MKFQALLLFPSCNSRPVLLHKCIFQIQNAQFVFICGCPTQLVETLWFHLQAHLFKYGVDSVHFAVNHITLLLPPVHFLNDAPELRRVRHAANGASGDLPVVSDRCLHDGLQYGEPYRRKGQKREHDPED